MKQLSGEMFFCRMCCVLLLLRFKTAPKKPTPWIWQNLLEDFADLPLKAIYYGHFGGGGGGGGGGRGRE